MMHWMQRGVISGTGAGTGIAQAAAGDPTIGMISDMSEPPGTEKLSASVPRGLAAQIRERAGRGNVSAYVTHALLRQLEHDRLGDLVAELEQVHGPVTDDEVAAARSEWPRDES
jgi:hypothetical protein